MPVKAFIGLQRQGKSYSAVKYALLPALRKGRTVVTNIALKQKAIDEFPNLIYQESIDYKNPVPGALYVIDEIWKDCAKGVTAAKTPEEFKQFFAMSGHLVGDNGLTTEIIVITQNLETQICDYILGQIETTYYVKKKALTEGIKKCQTTEYQGIVKGNPPRGKKEGVKLEPYDPQVFEYYKSNSGAEEGQTAIEMDAVKSKTLLDNPFVKYGLVGGIIVLPFLIYFVFNSLGNLFPDQKEPIKIQNKVNSSSIADNTFDYEQNNPITKPIIKKDNSKKIELLTNYYEYFDEHNVFPASKDKRITGAYKYITNGFKWEGVHVTIRNQKTINVPMHMVRIDEFGEYFLVYRNELVTNTTGEPPTEYIAYLPNGDPAPKPDTEQYYEDNQQIQGNER